MDQSANLCWCRFGPTASKKLITVPTNLRTARSMKRVQVSCHLWQRALDGVHESIRVLKDTTSKLMQVLGSQTSQQQMTLESRSHSHCPPCHCLHQPSYICLYHAKSAQCQLPLLTLTCAQHKQSNKELYSNHYWLLLNLMAEALNPLKTVL